MEIEKLFNPKKTVFLTIDEQGRMGARGRFFDELKLEEYPTIKGCVLSGFKKKNLTEFVDLFPNIVELFIEKTSNLLSLEGMNRLTDLKVITIENCPKLIDLSSLYNCTKLYDVKLDAFKMSTKVLNYISPDTIKRLALHGNVTDLDKIIDFKNLEYLTLNGYECNLDTLPTLPKVKKNFNLNGFPLLKNASFMENFDTNMRITWWGPKPIDGIPNHLKDFDTFK